MTDLYKSLSDKELLDMGAEHVIGDVVALYHVLQDSYRLHNGSDAGLLPQHEGWRYSPLWTTPRPIGNTNPYAGQEFAPIPEPIKKANAPVGLDEQQVDQWMRQQKQLRLEEIAQSLAWSDARNDPEYANVAVKHEEEDALHIMRVVDKRVADRAYAMRRRRVEELFEQVVERAKQDVGAALDLLIELETKRDEQPETGSFTQAATVLDDAIAQVETKSHLLKARLHWLKTWQKVEKVAWLKNPDTTKVSDWIGLIKPEDVRDAEKAIGPLSQKVSVPYEELDELQGLWLAALLMRCGAGERDLRAVIEKSGESHNKTASWSNVFRRKMLSFEVKERNKQKLQGKST